MIYTIIFILIFSSILSTVLIRYITKYAYNHKLFDFHSKRKIHKGDIPRIGGVAFVPVAIVVFIIGCIFVYVESSISKECILSIIGLIISMIIVYLLGILDDIKGLRYRTKFTCQFLVGIVLCYSGLYIQNVNGFLGLYDVPFLFGCSVTIFFVILSINAFNFIDGIDGLSSSIAILSFVYYSIVLCLNDNPFFILPLIFIGVLVPFLYFNVFGKVSSKSKTFMGDTGSTILGLVICVLAIVVNEDPHTLYLHRNPTVIAFAPMLLPCFDVFNVVIYRLIKARNPFKADDNHFHHRLLKLGLSQHFALVLELIVHILITGLSIIMSFFMTINFVLGILLIIWILVNIILIHIIEKPSN